MGHARFSIRLNQINSNQIRNKYFPKSEVRAGYIVPCHVGVTNAIYIFDSDVGPRLDSAKNCLLMHQSLKMFFNKGHFVLMPADPTEFWLRRWKLIDTNYSALDKPILGSVLSQMQKLCDLDGRKL
jgi:hypothetical protein